jgi:hypothetical protein
MTILLERIRSQPVTIVVQWHRQGLCPRASHTLRLPVDRCQRKSPEAQLPSSILAAWGLLI